MMRGGWCMLHVADVWYVWCLVYYLYDVWCIVDDV